MTTPTNDRERIEQGFKQNFRGADWRFAFWCCARHGRAELRRLRTRSYVFWTECEDREAFKENGSLRTGRLRLITDGSILTQRAVRAMAAKTGYRVEHDGGRTNPMVLVKAPQAREE